MIRKNMEPMSIIVAVDEDGGFGKDGNIPWNVPEDMKHFMSVTKGGICIMGRRTYEDMLEMSKARRKKSKNTSEIQEILPGRECYVVTSKENYNAEGATAVTSIREAVQLLTEDDNREVFILGGFRMFVESLAWVTTIHMTIIKGDTYNCDLFFPVDVLANFKIATGEETDQLRFLTYTR